MTDVSFDIFVETIDFSSENFDSKVKHVKKFEYYSTLLNQDDVNSLISSIIQKKGDWYTLNYDFSINDMTANITLIFHNPKLSEQENQLIEEVIEECNKFFERAKSNNCPEKSYCDELLDDEGFLLNITNEVESQIYISRSEIEEILREKNIKYKIVNTSGSQYEGGCSSGADAFILFVIASVKSGITWDIIKSLITSKLNIDFYRLDFQIIDNLKFRRMRKLVAERIHEKPSSLILKSFRKDPKKNKIYISMKCLRKRISVVCNNNYDIEELELE